MSAFSRYPLAPRFGVVPILVLQFAASLLALPVSRAQSAQLMLETFSYPDGRLVPNGGWEAHSAAGSNPVLVSGGAVTLRQSGASSEDVSRRFVLPDTSSKIYACFDLKVPSAPSPGPPAYFAHFRNTNSFDFRSRVYVAAIAGGDYTLGISTTVQTATPVVLWPAPLVFGRTYRIVHSYDDSTRTAELWVDPLDESSPKITSTGGALSSVPVGLYAFRQGGTSSGEPPHTSTEIIDNLVVATSFAEVCIIPDIAIRSVCVTLDDTLKLCRGGVFTEQPWNILFDLENKGTIPLPSWSFDIRLTDVATSQVIALKTQETGPGGPLQVGEVRRIHWPSPHRFTTADKGPWKVDVTVAIKDSLSPEPVARQADNQAGVTFEVENRPPGPLSDIGLVFACVARADTLQACTHTLFTEQPWHILFDVVNKGEKPIEIWSFDIGLLDSTRGQILPLKTQEPGPGGPLQIGEVRRVRWPAPRVFQATDKGGWWIDVKVAVQDPTNPEPLIMQNNNQASVTFQVENEPAPVSDLGVGFPCLMDTTKRSCLDIVRPGQPWHIPFVVFNQGEKPVHHWSFDVDLINLTSGETIPLKTQVPGEPLPLEGLTLFGTTTSGPGGPSDFYQIDPASGAATRIGPTGYLRVGALDAHPATGVLYATGVRAFDGTPVLITLDPSTGAGTEIGPTGMSAAISDLSFRPSDHALFAYDAIGFEHRLYRVDITSGAATLVGPTGFSASGGNGMAFAPGGTLFHGNPSSVNSLNPSTGAARVLFSPPNYPAGISRPSAFDFDPLSGRLFALYRDFAGGDLLGTYDVLAGRGTIIGSTQVNMDGIAFGIGRGSVRVNWPSPHVFAESEKGPWKVDVTARVNDPDNPEPVDRLGNNRASVTFQVQNLVSDIGLAFLCVTDSLQFSCLGEVRPGRPWHVVLQVYNKGEKPIDPWSFDIDLVDSLGGVRIPLATQEPGGVLQVGEFSVLHWPSSYRFDDAHKGTAWTVEARIQVKDPSNLEPPDRQFNNQAAWAFRVENPPSDIGIAFKCVTDSLRSRCLDLVRPGQPWSVAFDVYNKGEKPIDNWSFDIDLLKVGSGTIIGPTHPDIDGIAFRGGKLYGTTTAGPVGASDLYEIEPGTGASTFLGPIGFNRVGSLDAHPATGVLYAAGVRTIDGTPVLITIDSSTGAGTEVGPTGMTGAISDLSFRPSDHTLFAFDANAPDHRLYTVDVTTGAATLVGSTGFAFNGGNGMAFSPSGILYHGNFSSFNSLDPSTGAGTVLYSPPNWPPGADRPSAFDYDPATGLLYAAYKSGSSSVLGTYDPGGAPIPLKTQGSGAPLQLGEYRPIHWPVSHLFDDSHKGAQWQVSVQATVKDSSNLEPPERRFNNRASWRFRVDHPFSDIGIDFLCVADTLKTQCLDTLMTSEPWHVFIVVVNKGEEDVTDWSFDIDLASQATGETLAVKRRIPGAPIAPFGNQIINWPGPTLDATHKGSWLVNVRVAVGDSTNPEPPDRQFNNQASWKIVVVNPPVTDMGISSLCVSRDDSLKTCTDTLFTGQPWHTLFTVVNKGHKPIDNWSFDIELFHPASGARVVLKDQASVPALRWETRAPLFDPRTGSGVEGASASLIGGRIYVSHGYRFFDSPLLSIYDIGSNTWDHTGPDASVPRSEMGGGTALGKHYAIGGRTGPTAAVEEFDPGAATWTSMTPMSLARGGLGVASYAHRIYAIGGRGGGTFGSAPIYDRNEVFDPAAGVGGTWTALAPLPIAVSDNYATIAHLGKVYVFGGATDSSTVTSAVQIYDIATNTWSFGASMPTPRAAAMAGVIQGKIAVFGGYDGSSNLNVTELYDPATNSWSTGPPMPQPVSEISQGMTFDANGVYSIGSGIFGPARSDVYVLTKGATPIPVGGSLAINWPQSYRFDPLQKGEWNLTLSVRIEDPSNPDTSLVNNQAIARFQVLNRPPSLVTDIGITSLCVTDSTKTCRDVVFTGKPWNTLFTVANQGEKPVDRWRFDITLAHQDQPGAPVISLKQQVNGPPLPRGASVTFNWPAPFQFSDSALGRWQVDVRVVVTDPTNPDTSLANNHKTVKFFVDLPTATLLSLFLAEPSGEGLALRWQFEDSRTVATVLLERSEQPEGPWALVTAERRVEGDVTVVLDQNVEPGRAYYYRLLVQTVDGATFAHGPLVGTAQLAITEFALSRVVPNPSRGPTRIEFTVPREAPVRLSVMDIQGREVAVLATGRHRPGRFETLWDGRTGQGALPAGVYFICYQTPAAVRVRRWVMTR